MYVGGSAKFHIVALELLLPTLFSKFQTKSNASHYFSEKI